MGKWILVVVWDTGEKTTYSYESREEALAGGESMKMANGNQITWWDTYRAI